MMVLNNRSQVLLSAGERDLLSNPSDAGSLTLAMENNLSVYKFPRSGTIHREWFYHKALKDEGL